MCLKYRLGLFRNWVYLICKLEAAHCSLVNISHYLFHLLHWNKYLYPLPSIWYKTTVTMLISRPSLKTQLDTFFEFVNLLQFSQGVPPEYPNSRFMPNNYVKTTCLEKRLGGNWNYLQFLCHLFALGSQNLCNIRTSLTPSNNKIISGSTSCGSWETNCVLNQSIY